jgi:hypothetical protein
MKQRLAGVALVIASVGMFVACAGTLTTSDGGGGGGGGAPGLVTFQANDLAAEYYKDEEAANKKYKNNKLRVTGKVKSTYTDIVELETTQTYMGQEETLTIDCQYKASEKKKVGKLSPGNTVTFEGVFQGRWNPRGDIKITDCQLK